MLTIKILEPDGGSREVVCPDVEQCLEAVQFEVSTASPWTIVKLSRGDKPIATWGVGPHGRIARKPIRPASPYAKTLRMR
jgi:hypothetical protein